MATGADHDRSCDSRRHPLAVEVAHHLAAAKPNPQMNRSVVLHVRRAEVARASSLSVMLMGRESVLEKRYGLPRELARRINTALLQCTLDQLLSLLRLM